jgi:hypothetical protein
MTSNGVKLYQDTIVSYVVAHRKQEVKYAIEFRAVMGKRV